MKDIKETLKTKETITWCPGCPNFMILESAKIALASLIGKGWEKDNFCMTTDIGCNSKIFDYLNISGFYGLHGRAIPTAIGIKLGNPNLKVLSFMGDGAVYSEGIEHFVHAGRYNSDVTFIVHDNQSFSLTTGQVTPTSQIGFVSKVEPYGSVNKPLNPVKLALTCGFTFIARCNAKDLKHTAETIEKAIRHKGTSFVEVIQDCLIFNKDINNKDEFMYKIRDNFDKKNAEKLADEWDYNSRSGKIPVGVIYKSSEQTLEEKWPQLNNLMKKNKSWKNLNRK